MDHGIITDYATEICNRVIYSREGTYDTQQCTSFFGPDITLFFFMLTILTFLYTQTTLVDVFGLESSLEKLFWWSHRQIPLALFFKAGTPPAPFGSTSDCWSAVLTTSLSLLGFMLMGTCVFILKTVLQPFAFQLSTQHAVAQQH